MAKHAIRFDTNKKGKKVAFYYSRMQRRYFPMKLAEAELAVATGDVLEVEYGPNPWLNNVKEMYSEVDGNGITHTHYSFVLELVS